MAAPEPQPPADGRVVIAGTRSGCGKTTVTVALIAALKARGLPVAAFKCGPDYIDPMFHRRALGVPSHNLDPYFCPPPRLAALAARAGAGRLSVIEGAMGYYDGLGQTTTASTYEVARATISPAVLVLDGRGLAASAGAILQGFATYRTPSGLAGVIVNRPPAGRDGFFDNLIREAGLTPLGALPRHDAVTWPSRRLGLITADEITDLDAHIAALARLAEDHLDLDGLTTLARRATPLPAAPDDLDHRNHPDHSAASDHTDCSAAPDHPANSPASGCPDHTADPGHPASSDRPGDPADWPIRRGAPVRIAVARDEAFCFLYAETLELWERLGCELAFFSPLTDSRLPDGAGAVYLPGGYPENHLPALTANAPLRHQLRETIAAGLPTLAECGGFLYLHRDVDGIPLVGAIAASAAATGRLRRFGYTSLAIERDCLLGRAGDTLPAHEFHYYDSTDPGHDLTAHKAAGGAVYPGGHASATLYAGFPHLYLPARPAAAERFAAAARAYAGAAP
jgi:cobyrinic acid a,c-diamide synthase